MSVTFQEYAKGGADATSTTIVIDTTLSVAVGDLLVGAAKFEAASDTTIAISDNAASGGNTYTALTKRRHTTAALTAMPFYCIATKAGTLTVTATFGASVGYRAIVVGRYSSTNGLAFADDDYDEESAATAYSTPALTFAGAGLLVGLTVPYSTRTFTVAAPFVERYDPAIYYTGLFDRDISSAGGYAAAATFSAGVDGFVFGIGFEELSGAAQATAFQPNAF